MKWAATVIDIGGTHMRWAEWSVDNGVGARTSVPAPSFQRHPELTVPQLQMRLADAISEIPSCAQDTPVGISFGAAMNHRSTTVYASAPLWGSHAIPLDLRGELTLRTPAV